MEYLIELCVIQDIVTTYLREQTRKCLKFLDDYDKQKSWKKYKKGDCMESNQETNLGFQLGMEWVASHLRAIFCLMDHKANTLKYVITFMNVRMQR